MPSSPISPQGTSTPAKRACDACHRRKVRCVGGGDSTRPCQNCQASNLSCTFYTVPLKKGPKGSRAKVISELRDTSSISPSSPSLSRTSELLPAELIDFCVDYFFSNVYPMQPILPRQSVQHSIAGMHQPDAYCLIVALCAYMMVQPHMQLPPGLQPDAQTGSVQNLGTKLLADVMETRKHYNYVEECTVSTITTSFFLFGSHICHDRHKVAWYYLREATTLALSLDMHKEDTYSRTGLPDSIFMRRLYWLLFVTERSYALQAQKPISLYDTIALPSLEDDRREAAELTGFVHLACLFRPMDGTWNQNVEISNTEDWILSLQRQLMDALPYYLKSTAVPAVDMRVSGYWLRLMVVQLSIHQSLLSSNATDPAMTPQYPLQFSRDLSGHSSSVSLQDTEVHGTGIVKRLFDISWTLINILDYTPIEQASFGISPRDYLQNVLQVTSRIRSAQDRSLSSLVAPQNEMLPTMPLSSIPHGQSSSTPAYFEEYFRSNQGSDRSTQLPQAPQVQSYEGLADHRYPGLLGMNSYHQGQEETDVKPSSSENSSYQP